MTFHMPIQVPDHGDAYYAATAESAIRADAGADYYTLTADPARRLVQVRIAGFWSLATVERFSGDLRAAIASLGTRPGEHLTCCDVSHSAIQAQEVVGAFQQLIAHGPARARKLALFTTQVLSRMQARRIVSVRPGVAVFQTEADALRWLLEDTAPGA